MVEALRLTVAALNSSQLFFATSHMNSWTPPQKKSYCTRAPSYYSSKSSLSKSCCCLAFDSMTTSSEKRLRPFFYVVRYTHYYSRYFKARENHHTSSQLGKMAFLYLILQLSLQYTKHCKMDVQFWKRLKLLIKILISNVKAVIRPFERPMKKLNIKSKKDWFFRGQKFFSDPALLYLLTLRWYMSIARWFYLQNRHLKTTHFSPIFQIF